MRKTIKSLVIIICMLAVSLVYAQKPTDTPISQMEKLDRGLVVVPYQSGKYFVSWRMFGTDDEYTTFELLKNGNSLQKDIYKTTSLNNISATINDKFQIVTYQNGQKVETSAEVSPLSKAFLELPLDRPEAGSDYTYSPNDCSVGDVDGDGQYEIFVKWDPSNSKDNSQNGMTGNVYLDCYKLDGTKLWRIDLGMNIRAGAHYTQFMVFDFDGDGKAEMMCKTAPGSKDGEGNYVSSVASEATITSVDNTKDWRNTSGRIIGGQEYLTVFNGLTGKAIHTIFYNPNRDQGYGGAASGTFNWGTPDNKSDAASYGNRGERYLAAVAYLDGADKNPSGIFSRGYYGYAFIWAVDFDGTLLKQKWLHASKSKTQYSVTTYDTNGNGTTKTYTPGAATSGRERNTMFGNGNHNLSIGDVDGDGKDEVIWGSAALDNDGTLLYSVGYGHGDAIHLGDLNPDHPGLELFDIHEDGEPEAWDIHDAATGEILLKGGQSGIDNGRGLAADIVADTRGYEFWSAYGGFSSDSRNQNPYNTITGTQVGTTTPSMNFRIYWDGDAQDELLDGITITKYPSSTALGIGRANISGQSNNSTKAVPCLSADIYGDWREEVIVRNNTDDALNIYSTATKTNYRVPTLMHDHTYRMGVAWQNVGYNQPPHLGYYLPDYIESFQGVDPSTITGIQTVETKDKTDNTFYNLTGVQVKKPTKGIYITNGKKTYIK